MARAPRTTKAINSEPPAAREHGKRRKRDVEREAIFGARIRTARLAAGMSQTVLGNTIGISFQQMQKYEKGADRVAISTLESIAAALGVHPGSFFDENMPVPIGSASDVKVALRLAERIQRLRDPVTLKSLIALVDALVEAEDDQPAITSAETP